MRTEERKVPKMTLKDLWRMGTSASKQDQQSPQINTTLTALSCEESLFTQSEKMTVSRLLALLP